MTARFVVLGLAGVRAVWPREVTGWAMSGALPIDFTKCVSAEEVRARLRSGRTHSAVLVGSDATGADRDLLAAVNDAGAAAIVVASDDTDWSALGASDQLHEVFGRDDLLERLTSCAQPIGDDIGPASASTARADDASGTQRLGAMVAVVGRGGAGSSTLAAALTQAASHRAPSAAVVLADLARNGDQAMLHDATDVVPGLQELVEAHRNANCSATRVRSMTFRMTTRGYDVLLGRRRPSDWVALRPAATEAALDGLRHAYDLVVCDADADVEGEHETGSIDVEERNITSRLAVRTSDVVLVVSDAGLSGLHRLVRLVDELVRFGVDVERIVPVLNHAPRTARRRAELTASFAALIEPAIRADLHPPLFVRRQRHTEDAHRSGTQLPSQLGADIHATVERLLDQLSTVEPVDDAPARVVVGSLAAALGVEVEK